ncbi:hypothetical protein Q9189_007678 [Teloschistes chrysophthalmus]
MAAKGGFDVQYTRGLQTWRFRSLARPWIVSVVRGEVIGVNVTLTLATLSGLGGYVGFAKLNSSTVTPVLILTVALLGISQIGIIVASLSLVSHFVLDDGGPVGQKLVVDHNSVAYSEEAALLPERPATFETHEHLKGTIAGIYSFAGSTINALFALKRVTPQALTDEPLCYSPTERPAELYDVPSSRILHRGQSFFDRIYGKVSKRVMGQMDRSGTEDLGIVARLMYGYILSNTNVLSAAESSFVLIAGLIPQDVSN